MTLREEVSRINKIYGQQYVKLDEYCQVDGLPMSFPGDIAYSGEEICVWTNPEDGETYSISAYVAKQAGFKFVD